MKNEIKTIAFRCNYDTITNLQLCIDQISYDIPCIMASISGQYNVRCVFEKVINQLTYDDFILGELINQTSLEQLCIDKKSNIQLVSKKTGLPEFKIPFSLQGKFHVGIKIFKDTPTHTFPSMDVLPIPTEVITIYIYFSETEIKALAQGDTKVFHKLYEHFFVALCIFARSFSLKPEEAEDIVQEVFCRMYDEHRLFEGLNTLKSYLYTAVRNRSFNYLRDEKRRSIREAQFLNNLKAEEEGYNSALENEIYRQLKLLLEELPEQCKNIFQRTLSGDTSEKIAADLKLSVETVKTQRKKAKRILRERYTLLFKTFGILF